MSTFSTQRRGFAPILGPGRGRRPAIPTNQVNRLIEELRDGQETIVAEQIIARPNISEANRSRLKTALGQRRFFDQTEKISLVARLTGLLPRVDSQGLLSVSDRQMHRWPGHWHSQESLLMAPASLRSATNCGLPVCGGDNNWQPLGIGDWQRRAARRCPRCTSVSYVNDVYQTQLHQAQESLSLALRNKPFPEVDDMLALRKDDWSTIIARVLHPLDAEEINASVYYDEEIETAWRQLLGTSLAQRPLSLEAAAAQALDCLSRQNRGLKTERWVEA